MFRKSVQDKIPMSQRVMLLSAFLWLMLSFIPTGQAQLYPLLDNLPDCNFSATLPDDNMMIGAVVYNIRTQQGCTENLDEVFPVASVPKIFVAGALFDWVLSEDVISFDTELTFSERYWMGGRGDCLDGATLNERVTLGDLSDVMISCSDNAATWMLMDAMGWERVQAYIDGLGIEGIGPVIPYSEVDRQKLIALDERWESVPIAMASRFWRSDMTSGLETYFNADIPQYGRHEELEANQIYFDTTNYNTLTPRALAEYMLKLGDDSYRTDDTGQVARWLFNTMLLTQRQFSAQAFPGEYSVGAKNGFDQGLRAEVNVLFNYLPERDRNPDAFTLVFVRQKDLNADNIQPPTTSDRGILNQYLLTLSPVMSDILFPFYAPSDVIFSGQVSSVVVNPKLVMDACWNPYEAQGYLLSYRGQLENCWLNQRESQIAPGDNIGVGMILQNLNQRDARLTYVFTQPDGQRRSYQTQLFFRDSTAMYWYHPVPDDAIGEWTVDVYINRARVFTKTVNVQPLF